MKTLRISKAVQIKPSKKIKQNKSTDEISVLIFNMGLAKFALRLSNIKEIHIEHSNIFSIDKINSSIVGFCLNNNKLITIIDINYIINTLASNNNKQLIEISRNNIEVGILIDENYFISKINLPCESSNNSTYKFIEKTWQLNDERYFLIDEVALFSEIQKQITISHENN